MKQLQKTTREEKALQLYKAGAVKRIHDDCYMVRSQSKRGREYEVIPSLNVCTCTDFERKAADCKHILCVKIFRINEIQAIITTLQLEKLSQFGKVVGVAAK
jgi:predicted nucleic acid-binding Zn finger protein